MVHCIRLQNIVNLTLKSHTLSNLMRAVRLRMPWLLTNPGTTVDMS